MNVPFLDLKRQYLSLKDPLDRAWQSVVEESAFIRSHFVSDFEREFSKAYGIRHCIGVANGTDAIYIILKCLGIGAGDEVITVANTWISTSETISQAGARPVFADIEKEFFCIDADQVEQKINQKTKAIIAVHLFGQAAEVTKLKQLCDKHRLFLIEDCAQSHFTSFENRLVGTFGVAASFSFYPGKNLGAYGDAGAVITNDDALAEKMRMFANHGSLVKHQHKIEGINSRLDGLQAAILSVKLAQIQKWNQQRNALAANYQPLLSGVREIELPKTRKNVYHTWHLYVIRAQRRNELQSYLKEKGIDTQIHYPVPLPFLEAYQYLAHSESDFPVAKFYQSQILSLPMFPELTPAEQEYVSDQIKNFYTR